MRSFVLLLACVQTLALTTTTRLHSEELHTRRAVLCSPLALAPLVFVPSVAVAAAPTEESLISELRSVKTALLPLPALLEEEKWDAVRSVLKVPPVGNLWNLGDSKNTLRKLADMRDDVELFELADDVSSALQLADQFTYDNNFIYYQPGNGKVKIKEPKQQVQLAISKLDTLLK
mmetsp:Transcript_64483/g.127369  ORF Transcript_64483/g.127369 Transcript_64483/m.127369 type:complete len:175 (-) Transcript_64483:306-830(-)